MATPNPVAPAFIDTSAHIRVSFGNWPTSVHPSGRVADLRTFSALVVTSEYAKMEYKNVLLYRLQTLRNLLLAESSYTEAVSRANRVTARYRNILVHVASWVLSKMFEQASTVGVPAGSALDKELAERAVHYINNAIEFLWYQYDGQYDRVSPSIGCDRAREAPERRKDGVVRVAMNENKCATGNCGILAFVRTKKGKLSQVSNAIQKAIETGDSTKELDDIKALCDDKESLSSSKLRKWDECRKYGDLWLHLAANESGCDRFVTANYKESKVLCPALGLTMSNVDDRVSGGV
jgi:hypothetical protein